MRYCPLTAKDFNFLENPEITDSKLYLVSPPRRVYVLKASHYCLFITETHGDAFIRVQADVEGPGWGTYLEANSQQEFLNDLKAATQANPLRAGTDQQSSGI